MRRLAMLSMHTSPLAQPGVGDGGGMNVYVRQLAAALAHAGVLVDVYTRADDPALPAVVGVEPGLRVHHIAAGPLAPVAKASLPALVDEFTDGVAA
ncbi:MAG TPA: glycosyltransferase, partial [Acidimicrobiales bacterium]|nr:glycosyltransferase [Acidimicrobiales bacterium]